MSEATKAEITVSGWRPVKKNSSLRGFLTFELADGLVVHDFCFHQRDDGTRWVGLPAREYSKDGETAWARVVDFATKESYSHFQKASLAAVNHYFAAKSAESARVTRADVDCAARGGKR